MKSNPKKARAKRLARWLNRLAQAGLIQVHGYVFFKGVAIPVTHP